MGDIREVWEWKGEADMSRRAPLRTCTHTRTHTHTCFQYRFECQICSHPPELLDSDPRSKIYRGGTSAHTRVHPLASWSQTGRRWARDNTPHREAHCWQLLLPCVPQLPLIQVRYRDCNITFFSPRIHWLNASSARNRSMRKTNVFCKHKVHPYEYITTGNAT